MNERIEDIMYRAGLTVQGCWDELDSYDRNAIMTFAQLIVRECVGVADDYVKDCTCEEHKNCKHPRSIIGRKIREHFGVEE